VPFASLRERDVGHKPCSTGGEGESMKLNRSFLGIVLLAALIPACATTSAEQPTSGNWVLYGRVENVRQTVHRDQGDPGAGAAAGAIIGGVLGTALGGRGFGTFVGAAEGAMIGAQASQGSYVGYSFEVFVRFDDGSLRRFVYDDQLPFRPGDYVVWTPQGLARR
jgi:outer membrane lipoprotein SlyB